MKTRLLAAAALLLPALSPAATQTVIPGPQGSNFFGNRVTKLPNGNFVVVDTGFSLANPPVLGVGAVYLYSPQGGLISTLVGSQANDGVGGGGVTILASGHFVVRSAFWDNGAETNAGAVTWGHAETGFGAGQVVTLSPANSLVGSHSADGMGNNAVTVLSNGHYLVCTPFWDHGAVVNAGAVTWGNGFTGTSGPVTTANSLVGSQAEDRVGSQDIVVLTNGHYVVTSHLWDNGPETNAGAVTWGNGHTGTSGPVSESNSLVGSQSNDQVGLNGVTALSNGNYVAASPFWTNGPEANAGAATWCDGNGGTVGPVTMANSLVGSTLLDQVGGFGITALSNGNYVVINLNWDYDSITNAGAVTWGNGLGGTVGPVTPVNSLVGSQEYDQVGNERVTALSNGNYVVCSSIWDHGPNSNAGAVTWGNGLGSTIGPVSAANSLVGSQDEDRVGSEGIEALSNGNYVVRSSGWDNGPAVNAGAVTWGNGLGGTVGPVTPGNSLVGSQTEDRVGNYGVTALSNGNYVAGSVTWDNGSVVDAGAATWGNGKTGTRGPVTATNSLVGSQIYDQVGERIFALTNGHYVVGSPNWDRDAAGNAGAATWGNGLGGTVGPVTAANSLVGSQNNDQVGFSGTALSNGNFVVRSPYWKYGAIQSVGAVTWGHGMTGLRGPVTPANSLVGSQENDILGSSVVTALSDGHYLMRHLDWDNASLVNAGAVTFGNGETGTVGRVDTTNSVLGSMPGGGFGLIFAYDPARQQVIGGDYFGNRVTLFTPTRLHSLALGGQNAPGAADIAFGAPGAMAVDAAGAALFEAELTGSGAKTGKRGLFAPAAGGFTELVLRQGDALAALGLGLPPNATVASLGGPLRHGSLGGLFQVTAKGSGIIAANNRLLLHDTAGGVRALLRSGRPLSALDGASLNRPLEVTQSHDQDVIAVSYALNRGAIPLVNAGNDSGLLLLRHDGSVYGSMLAREGDLAFGGDGHFSQFTGRVAAGQGDTVHFSALFKPTVGNAVPALFSATLNGLTTAQTAAVGDLARGAEPSTFSSFRGFSQQGDSALFNATLKNSHSSANEGLWRGDGSPVLIRKGDEVEPGVTITRLLRFWPAGDTRVLLHVQLSNKSQALVLRQENSTYRILLSTGLPAPGVGIATLRTISAVDVNPVTGHYAVLGTLSGAPASANQALWNGNADLGNDTTDTVYRLPVLRLRKGQTYRTENTPQSVLRGISLRPALDPSGAGGRGLAQAIGSSGAIALVLTGDRKLSEVVVLR